MTLILEKGWTGGQSERNRTGGHGREDTGSEDTGGEDTGEEERTQEERTKEVRTQEEERAQDSRVPQLACRIPGIRVRIFQEDGSARNYRLR